VSANRAPVSRRWTVNGGDIEVELEMLDALEQLLAGER